MRLPPSSRKAVATVQGSAKEINRSDDYRVRKEKDINTTCVMSFPPGDEKASVSATRGFKSWFSTREAGLTVEATVTVSVKCAQDEMSIDIASTEAGKVAEAQAKLGIEEMGLYITAFQKDVR